ncbi:MAG: response regulator [Candidatus Lokiarchaeota archaeon]|nr:response regulator [Candidatus Harpocratesius repetitus]
MKKRLPRERSSFHSIFSRLPLMERFVIFGLLPILVTTLLTQIFYINRVQDLTWQGKEQEINEVLDNYAKSIDELLNRVGKIPKNLALNPSIINGTEDIFPDWFAKILEINLEIHNVYVAYKSIGNLTVTFRNNSKITTRVYPKSAYQNANQSWYDLPLKKREFAITKAYFDKDFMQIWMISLVCPILNESGNVIGMVGTDIALSQISSYISQIGSNSSRSAFVVENADHTQRIVATDTNNYIGLAFSEFINVTGAHEINALINEDWINFCYENSQNHYVGNYYNNQSNSFFLLFGKPISATNVNWSLYIQIPYSEIQNEIQRILLISIGISVLSLLLLTLLFLISAKSISRSINSFITQTNDVRKGIYEPIAVSSGGKELHQLRKNFNSMIDSIQKQIMEFRALADLLPFPIVSVVLPNKIVYINQAFQRLFGYDKAEITSTDDWFQLSISDEDYREKIKQYWKNILSSTNEVEKVQKSPKSIMMETKTGEKLEISIHLIMANENTAFIIFENISEQKLEEENRLRQQKLESLAIIAGGIAHDFNNILMGLLGNINLLQMEEDLTPFLRETLAMLEKSVIRARGITNQLLTFSKGGDPVIKLTDMENLIQEVVDFIMHGSNCQATIELESPLPLVEIDASQISQVLNNFLINAQQAMPSGGNITIKAYKETITEKSKIPHPAGDYLKCEVIDEGIGIDPQYFEKIFTPYFTLKPRGNGLGLATCYSIIQKHNGHIGFTSEVGKGSIFYFYLPCSASSSLNSIFENETEDFCAFNILILEDDLAIRTTLSKILTKWGCTISIANDGHEAIKLFQEAWIEKKPFQLVILDLTIPGGMGGRETLPYLREIDPNIIAIVASGYSNEKILSRYLEYGFNEVLQKPFTMTELRKTIQNAIKSAKNNQNPGSSK